MLRSVLTKVPFVGLTAATTAKNLFYGVKICHCSQSFLDEFVKEVSKYNGRGGSIISYCTTAMESEQENQRTVMETLRAVEKYSLLASCSEQRDRGRGNCDSFTRDKWERDLSKESFLLLFCIKSCGGSWGLNMPIDVLRGSRTRKIIDNNYDKIPVHGYGKDYTPAWWKALARLLIEHGYLKEVFNDFHRKVSVSSMGLQYLNTVNFLDQPPLILELTSEMIDEEGHGAQQENADDNKGSTDLEEERLSEVEKMLYDILLHTRMGLAKDNGTVPYFICGDQTLGKIAKIRPSSMARLASIEGVNQHFINLYGVKFLQTICTASQKLNLPLHGDAKRVAVTRKGSVRFEKNQIPAKIEAWNAWQVDKKKFKEIAMLGRSVPIKEDTVISYILEAAHTGCEVDWFRFCMEIGLTLEIFSQIRSAVSKIGSRGRLKPIKSELSENVTYEHIKTYLAMEALNVAGEEILGCNSLSLLNNSTKTECESTPEASMDGPLQSQCHILAHETAAAKLLTLTEDIESANHGLEASMDVPKQSQCDILTHENSAANLRTLTEDIESANHGFDASMEGPKQSQCDVLAHETSAAKLRTLTEDIESTNHGLEATEVSRLAMKDCP